MNLDELIAYRMRMMQMRLERNAAEAADMHGIYAGMSKGVCLLLAIAWSSAINLHGRDFCWPLPNMLYGDKLLRKYCQGLEGLGQKVNAHLALHVVQSYIATSCNLQTLSDVSLLDVELIFPWMNAGEERRRYPRNPVYTSNREDSLGMRGRCHRWESPRHCRMKGPRGHPFHHRGRSHSPPDR